MCKVKQVLTLTLCCISTLLHSQNIKRDTTEIRLSDFVTRISYANDAVFAGRTDSVRIPYLNSSMLFNHKSGLFVQGSISYLLLSNERRIDTYTFGLGYERALKDLTFNFSGVKYYFNDESDNVQSQIQGYSSISLDYNFGSANIYVDVTRYFIKENSDDFFLVSEINESLYLFKNQVLIQPTVYFEFGSQSYYESYYQNDARRSMHGMGSGGNPHQPNGSSLTVNESRKFQLLNIELSSSLAYLFGAFRLSVTPTYAIPLNPATVVINNEAFEEDLKPFVYGNATLSYRISF